jgi:hypothetical protein
MDTEQSLSPENSPGPSQSRNTPRPITDLPYPAPQSVPNSAAGSAPPQSSEKDSSEEEDLAHIALAEHLGHLSVDTIGGRFFGNSRFVLYAVQRVSRLIISTQRIHVPATGP